MKAVLDAKETRKVSVILGRQESMRTPAPRISGATHASNATPQAASTQRGVGAGSAVAGADAGDSRAATRRVRFIG